MGDFEMQESNILEEEHKSTSAYSTWDQEFPHFKSFYFACDFQRIKTDLEYIFGLTLLEEDFAEHFNVIMNVVTENLHVKNDHELLNFANQPLPTNLSNWFGTEDRIAFVVFKEILAKFAKYTLPFHGYDSLEKDHLNKLLINTDYHIGSFDVLANYCEFIDKSISKFQKLCNNIGENRYRGPFSVLCQSSGMGKTRLALECAEKGKIVIYICCRNVQANGFPLRTQLIADYILEHGFTDQFWITLYQIIFEEYEKSIIANGISSKNWPKYLLQDPVREKTFWVNVISAHKSIYSENSVTNENQDFNLPPSLQNETILIVFDEASTLIVEDSITKVSVLNRIRKTLGVVGKLFKIFGVFIDTNSCINNLFPADLRFYTTSSEREDTTVVPPKLLIPAYYLLPLCSILPSESMPVENISYFESHSIQFRPAAIALLSRPLFAIEVVNKCRDNSKSVTNEFLLARIQFACKKLICSVNLEPLRSSPIRSIEGSLSKFAVLASRFYLESTSSVHQQLLVKQYMATLIGLSLDGYSMIVRYESEPILAEAAAQLMMLPGVYESLLEELSHLLFQGVLSLPSEKGEVGELIASMSLCKAFDQASRKLLSSSSRSCTSTKDSNNNTLQSEIPLLDHILCRPIPLIDVLEQLVPEPEKSTLRTRNSSENKLKSLFSESPLRHGIVMFNHFVKLEEPVNDINFYKNCMKRGAAVLCQNGAKYIDMIIPVALPRSNLPINLWDFDSYDITLWLIQIKNWESPFCTKSLIMKIVMSEAFELIQRSNFYHTSGSKTSSAQNHVPVLCTAMNIRANHSTDLQKNVGEIMEFSVQEIEDAKKTKKQKESVDEAAYAKNADSKKESSRKINNKRKFSNENISVIGLQLCGYENFPAFTKKEKDWIKKLLEKQMKQRMVTQLMNGFLEKSEKETKQLLRSLDPFYTANSN